MSDIPRIQENIIELIERQSQKKLTNKQKQNVEFAISFYNQKDYKKAKELIEKIPFNNSSTLKEFKNKIKNQLGEK